MRPEVSGSDDGDPAAHPRTRLAVLTASLLGLVACAPGSAAAPDPFVPRYETDRLRIATTFTAELCRGHLEMWEDHLDILERELGLTRAHAWLMVYGSADESDQIRLDCDWQSSGALYGCWRDPVARGIPDLVPHELVHAWADTDQPTPLRALSEGLATRFSGLVPHADPSELTADDLLQPRVPSHRYVDLAHFVAWLLDVHGADATMALYVRAEHGMSADALDDAVHATLGVSTAELLARYRTTAAGYYPAAGAVACGQGPAIPWKDGAATWPADGTCLDGPFFGFDSTTYWQRVTIDVATAGTHELDPGGRPASVTRCLTAATDAESLPTLSSWTTGDWRHSSPADDLQFAYGFGPDEDWTARPLDLEVGRYEVWVRRSQENPTLGPEMRLRRHDAPP